MIWRVAWVVSILFLPAWPRVGPARQSPVAAPRPSFRTPQHVKSRCVRRRRRRWRCAADQGDALNQRLGGQEAVERVAVVERQGHLPFDVIERDRQVRQGQVDDRGLDPDPVRFRQAQLPMAAAVPVSQAVDARQSVVYPGRSARPSPARTTCRDRPGSRSGCACRANTSLHVLLEVIEWSVEVGRVARTRPPPCRTRNA